MTAETESDEEGELRESRQADLAGTSHQSKSQRSPKKSLHRSCSDQHSPLVKSILKKRDDVPCSPELGELRDLPDSPTPFLRSQRSRSGATNGPRSPPMLPSGKIGSTHVVKVPNIPPLPRKPFSEPDIFSSFKGNAKWNAQSKLGFGAPRTRTKLYMSPPPRDKSGGLMRRLPEEFVRGRYNESADDSLASESSFGDDQSFGYSYESRPWEGLYPGVVEQMRIDVSILDELETNELAHLIFVMADKIKSEEQAAKSKVARIAQLERELGKTGPAANAVPVITVLDEDSREIAPEVTETFNDTPSYLDEESKIPQLRSQLMVRDTQIGILQRSVEERDVQIDKLEAQLRECEAQACDWAEKGSRQQLALIEKERDIANLQVTVEEQRAAATEARKQLKAKEAVHVRLNTEVEERERMNLALQAEIKAAEAEIAALQVGVVERDAEIARLELEADAREAELTDVTLALEELEEEERYADAAESTDGKSESRLQHRVSTRELFEGMEALRLANDEAAADLTSARSQLRDALKRAAEFQRRASQAEDEADKARSAAERVEATLRKTRTLVAESNRQAHEAIHRAQTTPPSPSPPSSGSATSSTPSEIRSAIAVSLAAELATAQAHSANLESRLSELQLSLEATKLERAKFERLYEAHNAESVATSKDMLALKDEIEKLRCASADADMKVFSLQKTVQDLELKNEEMAVLISSYEIERQLRTPKGTPRGTPRATPSGTPHRADTPHRAGTPSLRQLVTTPKTVRSLRKELSETRSETPTPTPSQARVRKLATPVALPKREPSIMRTASTREATVTRSSSVREAPARSASLRDSSRGRGPLRASMRANVSSTSTDSAETQKECRNNKDEEKKERRSNKIYARAAANGSKLPRSRYSVSRLCSTMSSEDEM